MEPSEPDAGVLIYRPKRSEFWVFVGLFAFLTLFFLAVLFIIPDDPRKPNSHPPFWSVARWIVLIAAVGCFMGPKILHRKVEAGSRGLTVVTDQGARFVPWNSVTDYYEYIDSDGRSSFCIVAEGRNLLIPSYARSQALRAYIEGEAKSARSSRFEVRESLSVPPISVPAELGYEAMRAAWWRDLILLPLSVIVLSSPFVCLYFTIGSTAFDPAAKGLFAVLLFTVFICFLIWLRYESLVWRQLALHRGEKFTITADNILYEAPGVRRIVAWDEIKSLETGSVRNSLFLNYWRLHTPEGLIEFASQLEHAEGVAAYIAHQLEDLGMQDRAKWRIDDDTWNHRYGVHRVSASEGAVTALTAQNTINHRLLLFWVGLASFGCGLGICVSWLQSPGWVPLMLLLTPYFPLFPLLVWLWSRHLKVMVSSDGLRRQTRFNTKFMPWNEIEEYDRRIVRGHGRQLSLTVTFGTQQPVSDLLMDEIKTRAPQAKRRQMKTAA